MSASDAKQRLALAAVKALYDEFLACAPTRANGYRVRALYAGIFRSKLPHNDYSWLVDNKRAPERARQRADSLLAPRVKREVKSEPEDDNDDDDKARAAPSRATKRAGGTQMMQLDAMAERAREARTSGTVAYAGKDTLLTVATCSYTGRTPVGADTLDKLYGGDERREALRAIDRTMSARFGARALFGAAAAPGRANASVVNEIAQTFLAHALEPFDISLRIRFRRRIDEQLVVDNLVAIMREVEYRGGTRVRPAHYDDSVGEDDKRRFRTLFDSMHFNFFSRFPELAVPCDEHSPLPLVKALSALWAICGDVFCECALSRSGEEACEFMFNSAVDESIGTRAPLLAAIACAYIEGIGYERAFETKQLMLLAIETAQLHIVRLAGMVRRKPPFARYNLAALTRAIDACRQARETIAHYDHSQYAFMRAAAANR